MLLAGMILLTACAFGAFLLRQASVQAQNLVVHTQQVHIAAQDLFGALRDAETGERGYLLMEDPAYLLPYNKAVASIPGLQETLRQLVVDNPEQKSRLQAIDLIINKRLEKLATSVEFIKSGNHVDAQTRLQGGAGNQVMEEFRQAIKSFIETERALLGNRQISLQFLQNAGLTTTLISFLLAVALLGSLILLSRRQTFQLSRSNLSLKNEKLSLDSRISDQRNELRIGEAQHQFALDANQLGEWALDPVSDKSVRTPRHDQIFGYETPVEHWGFAEFIRHVVPEDRDALKASYQATVASKSDWRFECRIERANDHAIRWIEGVGRHYDTVDGSSQLVGLVDDITVRKNQEAVLLESEQRFRGTFDNAAVGVAHVGLDGRWLRVNQRLAGLVGYTEAELLNTTFMDITHPDDVVEDVDKVRQVLAGEIGNYSIDKRYIRKDGSTLWVALTVALQRNLNGEPAYFISVINDISARKSAVDHQQFLMRELSHRSKNLLAIVQSMAGQTAKSSLSMPDFDRRFGQRLQALAYSHDLLVDQNWRGAPLRELIVRQLASFTDASDKRLIITGPDVTLTAVASQSIGLALHELATNAVKYGALSVPAGKLNVSWSVDSFTKSPQRFQLHWAERDGPRVEKPIRTGFGHTVIERMTAMALNGQVRLEFLPEGVHWQLHAPVTCLAEQ